MRKFLLALVVLGCSGQRRAVPRPDPECATVAACRIEEARAKAVYSACGRGCEDEFRRMASLSELVAKMEATERSAERERSAAIVARRQSEDREAAARYEEQKTVRERDLRAEREQRIKEQREMQMLMELSLDERADRIRKCVREQRECDELVRKILGASLPMHRPELLKIYEEATKP